ncbi:hypothetical protein [Nocardioides pacificus]
MTEEVVAAGTSWLSITARGRASDAIGFGDDVAACAGLVVRDGDDLLPVGDASARPAGRRRCGGRGSRGTGLRGGAPDRRLDAARRG